MTVRLATAPVLTDLETIKRGIHVALDHLVNRKDYSEAERVMREVDQRVVGLINQTKVAE